MSLLNFLKIALKDYRTVGAFVPSSRYVVKRVSRSVRPTDKLVVEYGSGSGVITRAILERLPGEGRFIAIELKNDFAQALSAISDERFKVLHRDVISVLNNPSHFGIANADLVISGMPFLVLERGLKEEIFKKTYEILRIGGRFIFYQNSPLNSVELKRYFSKVSLEFEPRNLFPYFIFTAQK